MAKGLVEDKGANAGIDVSSACDNHRKSGWRQGGVDDS